MALRDHDLKVIFAVPDIVAGDRVRDLPLHRRELIPLMQAQGIEQEEAAVYWAPTAGRSFGA